MSVNNAQHVIQLSELPALSDKQKASGARFVQLLAVRVDEGTDLIYTWMIDGVLHDYKICSVADDAVVPSITNNFLAAFVFENEIHDLFGVNVKDIAIDFQGNFYALSMKTPMAVISPELKAEREKAKKLAAAKAAKEKAAPQAAPKEAPAASEAKPAPAVDQASIDAAVEAKLAKMDPEKAAKVRAAMEAKAKKAQAEAAEKKGE